MSLVDPLHSAATGSHRRRALLTPLGLVFFLGLLLLLLVAARCLDAWLGLPELMVGRRGTLVGLALTVAGVLLSGGCTAFFLRARGTPVPFNPPRELVTHGPYARTRNPMLTGVFVILFGVGFLLHSVSLVLFVTPAFIVANVIELRLMEEPELERRFGAEYADYRRRVPMFVPRFRFHTRKGHVV